MVERTREVSRSEYMAELGNVGRKVKRRKRLLREWRSMRGRLGWLTRRRNELIRRIPYVGIIERVRIGEEIGLIDKEMMSLRTQMRHIRSTELPALNEDIDRERREIAEKILPPPLREEMIADEECTGYDIWFDLDEEVYNIRDPDTRELIRREDKICMELTASIETREGHDVPVVVEITCTCYVEEMSLSDLIATENKVEDQLRAWLIEQGWGNLIAAFIKEGVAYNGEDHVEKKMRYTWTVPDYPKVHALVEKKRPRPRKYEGDFEVEE